MYIKYIMPNVIDVNGDAWVNQKSKVVIVIINENQSSFYILLTNLIMDLEIRKLVNNIVRYSIYTTQDENPLTVLTQKYHKKTPC